jgi:hypothetical protein
MDGLVSVLRLHFGAVVPATPLPTRIAILPNDPASNHGSEGVFWQYGGFSTPLDGPTGKGPDEPRRFLRTPTLCFSARECERCSRLRGLKPTASYLVTDTDWSAGGGKRRVTSVVFWERMEMRFAQSENIPFE